MSFEIVDEGRRKAIECCFFKNNLPKEITEKQQCDEWLMKVRKAE